MPSPSITENEFAFMSEMKRYDLFMRLYGSKDPEEQESLEMLFRSQDPMILLILLRYLQDLPDKKAMTAILQLIEDGNTVVSRSAMLAYGRSHYPGKARLLKRLILSHNFRGCRFAVRTLSRAGFMEVLPLVLREIPEREGNIRKVMINAVRFLPHRRSVPVLVPLVETEDDEHTRYLVVRALAELQPRTKALPASFFLDLLDDESERIRLAAMEALQRYPTRKVGPMLLKLAQKEDLSDESRMGAIRALRAFPSVSCIGAVVNIAAKARSASIRLSTEIVARKFPKKLLRKALVPLLSDKDHSVRRQAALFLAEFLGEEEAVRKILFEAWRNADESEALDLMDALRLLGGEDTVAMLCQAVKRSPLQAYAAAGALVHMRGVSPGPAILELVKDPSLSDLVRQALLDRWSKRGPDEDVREELLPELLGFLSNPTTNIRYLAAQALSAYPASSTLKPLLAMLARETSTEVIRLVSLQLIRGLSRDPIVLADAVRSHEDRELLGRHLVRMLLGEHWDPKRVPALLTALCGPELHFDRDRPRWFSAICVHLLEHNAVTLQDIWPALSQARCLELFLVLLLRAMSDRRRHFPLLPIPFLELQLAVLDREVRPLLYDLLGAEGRDGAAEFLAAALLREEDKDCLRRGTGHLRRLLLEVEE